MAMTPEGRVKHGVKKILNAKNVWYYMPVQNGMGVVGIPDFVGCYKGRMFAIECKAPGKRGNVTENQKAVLQKIAGAGGCWIVTDDPADAESLLRFMDATTVPSEDDRLSEEIPE